MKIEPIYQLEKNVNSVNTISHCVTETELKSLCNDYKNNYLGTENSVLNFSKDTKLTIESIGFIITQIK